MPAHPLLGPVAGIAVSTIVAATWLVVTWPSNDSSQDVDPPRLLDQFETSTPLRIIPYTPPTASVRVGSLSRAGQFDRGEPVTIAAVNIEAGSYLVSYSFEARIDPLVGASSLECELVDGDGTTLADDPYPVVPGGFAWDRHAVSAEVELPATSLGIRCTPMETAIEGVRFRYLTLSATSIESR